MDNESTFFQAIRREPEDVELRMVAADWYEERGDERAEFIRVQLALANLPVWHDWRPEMKARERDLFAAHHKRWNAPLHRLINESALKGRVHKRRAPCRGWEYRRGFVEVVRCEAQTFLDHADTLLKLGPVCCLRLWKTEGLLPRVLDTPAFSHFTGLDLRHNALSVTELNWLAVSPKLEHVTELNLAGTGLNDTTAELLITSHWLNFKRLVVSHNNLTEPCMLRLRDRFGGALQHQSGMEWGAREERTGLALMEDPFDRTVSYDDRILYEDGKMFIDGELADDDSPHRLPSEEEFDETTWIDWHEESVEDDDEWEDA